jgi:hypothetical protein
MLSVRTLAAGAWAAALLVAVGCGGGPDKPVKVEGVVTLDGQPVDGATVMFNPLASNGRQATGVTGEDGKFRLTTYSTGDGALPGDYKVTIEKPTTAAAAGVQPGTDLSQIDMTKMMLQMKKESERNRKQRAKVTGGIPTVYGDLAKTPLKERVPPDGLVKVELQSKGG